MAAINEAWSVLSDPARRARYDADLRTGVDASRASSSAPSTASTHRAPSSPRQFDVAPARFPWRFVVGVMLIGTAAILILGALTDGTGPSPIDNVVTVGSCVGLDDIRREAFEVECDGREDAVVAEMVAFDGVCAAGRPAYRDRQGLGKVCVVGR